MTRPSCIELLSTWLCIIDHCGGPQVRARQSNEVIAFLRREKVGDHENFGERDLNGAVFLGMIALQGQIYLSGSYRLYKAS